MKEFFYWLQKEEGWKPVLAIVYAIICLFDFILVPIGLNMMRKEVVHEHIMTVVSGLDPATQAEFIKAVYRNYVPLTTQGNGVFHMAFGALLTGSAISTFREKNTNG